MLLKPGNLNLGYFSVFHLKYEEPEVVIPDLLADLWKPSEKPEHKSADCMEVFAYKFRILRVH